MGNAINNEASANLMQQVVEAMQDKKANNILSLDLRKIPNSVTDYFVICDVASKIQAGAVYDNVLEKVKKTLGMNPFHREGLENAEWILVDYVDVVVHIFTEDTRSFYDLEGLWADAETKQYETFN
jgi:ribosome-associated protein